MKPNTDPFEAFNGKRKEIGECILNIMPKIYDKPNTDPLYNKTCAYVSMCLDQYRFARTIDIMLEAIDDHIRENLQRETDEAERQFFMTKKRKLMELV